MYYCSGRRDRKPHRNGKLVLPGDLKLFAGDADSDGQGGQELGFAEAFGTERTPQGYLHTIPRYAAYERWHSILRVEVNVLNI
jgi:hypothetical protein